MGRRRWAYSPLSLVSAGLIALIGGIWSLVCGFFAVREAHRLSDGQTIVTVVVGWLIVFIVTMIVTAVFGIGALGVGAVFGR